MQVMHRMFQFKKEYDVRWRIISARMDNRETVENELMYESETVPLIGRYENVLANFDGENS